MSHVILDPVLLWSISLQNDTVCHGDVHDIVHPTLDDTTCAFSNASQVSGVPISAGRKLNTPHPASLIVNTYLVAITLDEIPLWLFTSSSPRWSLKTNLIKACCQEKIAFT